MNGFKEVSLQHIPAIAAQLFELAHQKKSGLFMAIWVQEKPH